MKLYFYLPKKTRTRIHAYWMKSSFRKRRNIKNSKTLKDTRLIAIEKYGTFDSKELLQYLRLQGIKEGDVLFVQCSFNDLYTFADTPLKLLNTLKASVGTTGTLFFPAYTDTSKYKKEKAINLNLVPTYTGIVNEIFRRSPDVIRSLHPRHSICGFGSLAEEILKDHHKCKYADGLNSPFDKMQKLKNAKILTLGLPSCYMSFLHWMEDIEPNKLPFRIHKKEPVTHELILSNNNIYTVKDFEIDRSIVKLSLPLVCEKISKNSMYLTKHKGISINIYLMKPLAKELLKLRNQGVIHYQ